MNVALKRGIANWERSGQGDGGYTNDDDNFVIDGSNDDDNTADDDNNNDETFQFGDLKGRPQRALD